MILAARIHALFYADDHVARNQRVGFLLHREVAALGDARAVNPLGAAADAALHPRGLRW